MRTIELPSSVVGVFPDGCRCCAALQKQDDQIDFSLLLNVVGLLPLASIRHGRTHAFAAYAKQTRAPAHAHRARDATQAGEEANLAL